MQKVRFKQLKIKQQKLALQQQPKYF